MPTMKVTPEDFVTKWQKSDTIEEFIKATGLSEGGAQSRASNYRKRGIPLKKLKKTNPRQRTDWDALKKLATDLAE